MLLVSLFLSTPFPKLETMASSSPAAERFAQATDPEALASWANTQIAAAEGADAPKAGSSAEVEPGPKRKARACLSTRAKRRRSAGAASSSTAVSSETDAVAPPGSGGDTPLVPTPAPTAEGNSMSWTGW